jgi:hypothetical protein
MARPFCLIFLASILSAPAGAQDDAPKRATVPPVPPAAILSAPAFARDNPAPGFVHLDATIDPERAQPGAFPPEGIAVEYRGLANFGVCPIARLHVPTARVPEMQALLRSLEPQFAVQKDGWVTLKRR